MTAPAQLAFTLTPPTPRRRVTVRAESREAYQASREKAGAMRAKVLAYVRSKGSYGATADEICAAWGCSPNTVAPRLTELRKSGAVVVLSWGGFTIRRKTRAGASAAVLVVRE